MLDIVDLIFQAILWSALCRFSKSSRSST